MPKTISRFALAIFFVVAGTLHFLKPAPYLEIMPAFVPWPCAMVAISGAAEILGGLGVCVPITRRLACWCLIALLVAVFPANIQAIFIGIRMGGVEIPAWLLWARLPFQPLLIWWVYSVARD